MFTLAKVQKQSSRTILLNVCSAAVLQIYGRTPKHSCGSGIPKMLLCRTSFCLFVQKFSWDWVVSFFQTWHDVRGPCGVVCGRARFFGFFSQKMGKMGQKSDFLNLLENFVINFLWIWSLKKVYVVCCILAQIPYLGKIIFLAYGPVSRIFKLIMSLELNYEKAWLFVCSYRLMKIKISLKKIGLGIV